MTACGRSEDLIARYLLLSHVVRRAATSAAVDRCSLSRATCAYEMQRQWIAALTDESRGTL